MGPRSTERRRSIVAIALLAGVTATAGCGARHRTRDTTYHDERMDFSLIRSVVVMPFANFSGAQPAAERVRDTFMTALQGVGTLYVVPPGEVARGIERNGIRTPAAPSPEEVVALCRALEADAVITGSVLEYGEARSASASAEYVSLSLKLLESETGRVVWSASATRGGVGAKERLLGGGGRPMNEVTLDAVRDLIGRLFD